jgi:hypothetical protein
MRKKGLGKAQLRKRRAVIRFRRQCREHQNIEGGDPNWGTPFRRLKERIVEICTGEYTRIRKRPKTEKVIVLIKQGPFKPMEPLREFVRRIDGKKVARTK